MPTDSTNPFGARGTLQLGNETATVYRLAELARQGLADLDRLPFSIRVLLENALRHAGRGFVTEATSATWPGGAPTRAARRTNAVHAGPGRAAGLHRGALRGGPGRDAGRHGADEGRPRPDQSGGPLRPRHRSLGPGGLLRLGARRSSSTSSWSWSATSSATSSSSSPSARSATSAWSRPGTGIVHQVNLEYLAPVVQLREQFGELTAYPDTLVGTDSHTTMINGLGVLGWGVGGIEAEAVMLGQPYFMLIPEVVGHEADRRAARSAPPPPISCSPPPRCSGRRAWWTSSSSSSAPGSPRSAWPTAPRSPTWRPEYGATMGFFPVDAETLRYLERTGRGEGRSSSGSSATARSRGSSAPTRRRSRSSPRPSSSTSRPSCPRLAGPKRPQDLVPLAHAQAELHRQLAELMSPGVPAARKELAQGAYSRWMNEGGASVTIGEGGAGEHRRSGSRRAAGRLRQARRGATSASTMAPSSSPPSPAAPTPPTRR